MFNLTEVLLKKKRHVIFLPEKCNFIIWTWFCNFIGFCILGPLLSAERPIVSPMSVYSSLCPSICSPFFSERTHFLFFYMILWVNNCQKLTNPNVLGKFPLGYIWVRQAKNGSKGVFNLFLSKMSFDFLKNSRELKIVVYFLAQILYL